ncbi:hypothetical protein TNCV_120781 [Trichonephila clavipes]|nr:hypothetical protein TNCV_120781 [Trichonephila clavipes]
MLNKVPYHPLNIGMAAATFIKEVPRKESNGVGSSERAGQSSTPPYRTYHYLVSEFLEEVVLQWGWSVRRRVVMLEN